MPTVVDAFIMTLGLDASEFDKGQKAAAAAFLKTKDAAAAAGKDIEDSSKRSADAIDRVTKSALGLFAVLVGARSFGDFVSNITQADVALGNLSGNLGMSAQDLAKWEGAAVRVGDTAEGAASAIQAASDQLLNLRTNGTPLPTSLVRLFSQSGITPNLNTDTTAQYLSELSRAAGIYEKRYGRQQAAFLLQHAGLGGLANLLLGGNAQKTVADVPAPTNQTVANAADWQNRWSKLTQTASNDANNAVMSGEPAARPFLGDFQRFFDWLGSNQGLLDRFGKWLENGANWLGQWRYAIEGFIAAFTGAKFINIIQWLLKLIGVGSGPTGFFRLLLKALAPILTSVAGRILGPVGDYLASTTPVGAGEDALVHSMGLTRLPGSSGTGSQSSYIRASALLHGIDPSIALKVAQSEGLGASYLGDAGSSAGPYQLHYGSVSSQFPHSGLGDLFTKDTGLNARDPSTWKAQVDWVMDYVSTHGWNDWSGAKASGIVGFAGVGAANSWAAARAAVFGQASGLANNVRIGVIHITVGSPADATKIANSIGPAIKRATIAQPANYGPA